jgi:RimJ/RimL family protein N-acetyltransferase
MNLELLALVRQDWGRVVADPEAFAKDRELTLGVDVGLLRTVAEQTIGLIDRTGAESPPWTGFLAVDRAQNVIVGTCGFNGPPDLEGVVEIAYFTFPLFEGRGVASMMAAGLIDRVRSEARVRRFIAHTLPKESASTRVLAKIGFVRMGQIVDPEDGPVWRWELDRGTTTGKRAYIL